MNTHDIRIVNKLVLSFRCLRHACSVIVLPIGLEILQVSLFVFGICILISIMFSSRVTAQWSDSSNTNNAICSAANSQDRPVVVSDDSGGAIITWQDRRDGNRHIYAQKVDIRGRTEWGATGVSICTAAGVQIAPTITSDGAGGAIITWFGAAGTDKVYAQHVDFDGFVRWPVDGLPICSAGGAQEYPCIVADGKGGAIIAWRDMRNGVNYDIFAQRISAAGQLMWSTEGVAICRAAGSQYWPAIVTGHAGGAIITWQDYRNINSDVYAQRVDSNGIVKWTMDGVSLSSAGGDQTSPTIVSDLAGGAIVTWNSQSDIYAQRVDTSGAVLWTTNGVPVCTALNLQETPHMASDGTGGAIITWKDFRSGTYDDIYAQRLSGNGAVQWEVNGISICGAPNAQYYGYMSEQSNIVSDGSGGAIITWEDHRRVDINSDIYAQRVNGAGVTQWVTNGVPICTAADSQFNPVISSDWAGGAIITWVDRRNGNFDIYAQNINRYGFLGFRPTLLNVHDVISDQGGKVMLRWGALPLDKNPAYLTHYSIWRSVPEGFFPNTGKMVFEDYRNRIDVPTFRMQSINGLNYYWEWIANQPAHSFSEYSYTAATLYDSISTTNGKHYFLVSAHTNDPNVFFDSNIDSGYSVDNIAPFAPRAFVASFASASVNMHWNANGESDLNGYVLYRGSSPENMAQFATTKDTQYIDSSPISGNSYYAVRARDAHENLSPFSNTIVTGITDGNSRIPTEYALSLNYPNPFNPTTMIKYQLPARSIVTLRVYNLLGQVVRELKNEVEESGYKSAEWNASGVASGIYFYRLEAISVTDPSKPYTQIRKMLLLK